MLNLYSIALFPLLLAFIITVLAVPISLFFLRRFKVLDDPKKHKPPAIIHTNPIPRGGGIALFMGVLVASLFFIPFSQIIVAAFIAAFVSLFVGVIDDKFDISPYARFLVNIGCAIFVVYFGAHINFITNPFGGILHLNQLSIPFLNH